MNQGLTYLGELSIGGICPLVVSAAADITAALNAQLAGALALVAALQITPPTINVNISLVTALLAQLQIALELGLPGVDFQISACLAFIAQLEAELAILLQLTGLFAAAGIFAYEYSGPADELGPALTSELADGTRDGQGGSTQLKAIVLATRLSATWGAMQTFFAGAAA